MKTNKPFPALCQDCFYANANPEISWTHKCVHPKVVAAHPYVLACNFEGRPYGVDCTEERRKRGFFVPCGIKGKLWEPRERRNEND